MNARWGNDRNMEKHCICQIYHSQKHARTELQKSYHGSQSLSCVGWHPEELSLVA